MKKTSIVIAALFSLICFADSAPAQVAPSIHVNEKQNIALIRKKAKIALVLNRISGRTTYYPDASKMFASAITPFLEKAGFTVIDYDKTQIVKEKSSEMMNQMAMWPFALRIGVMLDADYILSYTGIVDDTQHVTGMSFIISDCNNGGRSVLDMEWKGEEHSIPKLAQQIGEQFLKEMGK